MITVNLQLGKDRRTLHPATPEDLEKLREYAPNQILKAKLTGHRKPRSVIQNCWIHALFRLVADNSDDPDWSTPEKVKRIVKMKIGYYDARFVVKDSVYFELRSFAFDELGPDEANRVFNECKRVCAEKLGVPEEALEANAKELPF